MKTQELTENSLTLYFDNNQVEAETKNTLLQSFENFFTQTQEWKDKASGLVITSADQKEEIKQAKEARIALKNIRVNTEHKRKELKEESLRKGQTIDAIAKIITNEILPIEEHLEKQEKFIEIQEANRKAELKRNRETSLAEYNVEGQFYDLGNMPVETYNQLLENSRVAHEAKIQAALVAEAERIANEKAAEEKRFAEVEAEKQRQAQRDAELAEIKLLEDKRQKSYDANKKKSELTLLSMGFEKTDSGVSHKEVHHFIGSNHYSFFETTIEMTNWVYEVQSSVDNAITEKKLKESAQKEAADKKAELDKAYAELERKKLQEEKEKQRKIAEQKEREAKAKALLLAPDKEKVKAFFEQFKLLQFPELESEAGKAMSLRVNEALSVVKQLIIQDSKSLI